MTGTEMVVADGVEVDAVAKVERQVTEAKAAADEIRVGNEGEAQVAAEFLARIAKQKRQAERERKDLTAPILEAKRRIDQRFKDVLAPLDAADRIVRGKVKTYADEQERIRREEEERLERERLKREQEAREARERQEAEARAKREQAEREAREAAERARREDDEAAKTAAEEAAEALRDAQTAEQAVKGLPEPTLPKAVVEPAAPLRSASGGVSTRKVRKFRVVDESRVPRRFLAVNETEIRGAVRDGIDEIPGVEIYEDTELAVRTS